MRTKIGFDKIVETTNYPKKTSRVFYRITSIEGVCTMDKLPREYFGIYPMYYLTEHNKLKVIYGSNTEKYYDIGSLLDKFEYTKLLSTLRTAGERLATINSREDNIVDTFEVCI